MNIDPLCFPSRVQFCCNSITANMAQEGSKNTKLLAKSIRHITDSQTTSRHPSNNLLLVGKEMFLLIFLTEKPSRTTVSYNKNNNNSPIIILRANIYWVFTMAQHYFKHFTYLIPPIERWRKHTLKPVLLTMCYGTKASVTYKDRP